MYGGVATPLALLHQNETNGRKQYNQIQTRATSSREVENGSYSVANSVMPRVMPLSGPRLPPLRETSHNREMSQNGENEPLLPTHVPKVQNIRFNNGNRKIQEPDLPPPPLPPHKNGQKMNLDLKYTPPWPRGPSPNALNFNKVDQKNGHNINNEFKVTNVNIPPSDIKPYLKPLPKPPTKDNQKYQRQASVPMTRQVFRLDNLRQDKSKTKNIQNPLYHLQRHYSDESLQGQGSGRPSDSPLR